MRAVKDNPEQVDNLLSKSLELGSDERLSMIEDEANQLIFESLNQKDQINFLKELWSSSDLPAKQLAELDYDLLGHIEGYYFLPDTGDMLYRVMLLDDDLEPINDKCELPFSLAGSWTTSEDVADFFVKHVQTGRYQLMFKNRWDFPKHVYVLSVDQASAQVLWEDDSRNEAEVMVKDIDDAVICAQKIGSFKS